MRLSVFRNRWITPWCAWLLAWIMIGLPIPAVAGICAPDDLSDLPLELTAGSGPPAFLLISFDNSDSMGFEVLTSDLDRQFTHPVDGSKHNYVFNSAGGAYTALIRDAWQSQFYQVNKMYYNPLVGRRNEYLPWPTKADVSTSTPPWNPQNLAGATYNLAGTWATYQIGLPPDEEEEEEESAPVIALEDPNAVTSNPAGRWQESNDADDIGGHAFVTGGFKNDVFNATWTTNAVSPDISYNLQIYRRKAQDAAIFRIYDGDAEVGSRNLAALSGWQTLVENITFTSGQALIRMTLTKSKNVYTTSADAVRLVPVGGGAGGGDVTTPKEIKNRHFYVRSVNGNIYLVNLMSADSVEFYQLSDANGNGVIDDGELVEKQFADLPFDLKEENGGPLPAPGADAYQTHMRNFANWFTFYRTRRASAQNALAVVITEIKNMLVGMMTSPPTLKQGLVWINTNFDGQHFDMTANFLNVLYNLPAAGSARPFPSDILDMGDYYEKTGGTFATAGDKALLTGPGYSTAPGTYPFFKAEYGGTCQQSFSLIITDGSSTGGSTIKNFDRGSPTDGNEDIDSLYDGGVFGDAFNNTAADGAMGFYERDLIPSLANEVPTNYIDYAQHQRMVTYALSLGVEGPLRQAYPHFDALCADFNNNNVCICDAGCPTWGDPNPSPSNPNPMDPMDDLWHATVNSRGLFLYADNPMELIRQLRLIKSDIERRQGSAAAVTTNTVQRTIETTIYQGLYHSGGWWGDLLAKSVEVATGGIGTTIWSARDQLEEVYWDDRNIFTSYSNSGMDFTSAIAGTIGLTAAEVNYIRGDHTNEGPNEFRFREFMLGDIIHSEPYYYKGALYVGANDGMMHAFDAATGEELFAYVPSQVHAQLVELTRTGYEHLYFVDATPHVNSISGGPDYLAGGLGKGGKGVYSLNVTTVRSSPVANTIFNWEFSDAADADVGYVFGQAYVTKTNDGSTAVIFPNGYVSANGKAVLFVLDATDGSVIKKFDTGNTGTAGCNGLSSPSLVDYNFDGATDYVYAGDLDGNLWKFDMSDSDPANWAIAYGGNPLFTARDPAGNVQAITSEPDIMLHCDRSRVGFIVVFGTGRYLNADDLEFNPANQAIYGIYDWEKDWIVAGKESSDKNLGALDGHGGLSNINFATLVEQTKLADVAVGGEIYRVTSNEDVIFYNPYLGETIDQSGTHVGWYYLLPDATERVVRNPIIRSGVVIAVANTIESGICSGSAGSYLYTLNACSGGQPYRPQFDLNGDGIFDESDTVTIGGQTYYPGGKRYDTMLFDPVAMSGSSGTVLYINDTFGRIRLDEKPPAGPNMRYWRLIE